MTYEQAVVAERVEDLLEQLHELVGLDAPKHEVKAKLQQLDSLIGCILEVDHQIEGHLDREASERKVKPPPTDAERHARALLRLTMSRLECGANSDTLLVEARTHARFVRKAEIDGSLVRRALIASAESGGMPTDEIERVLAFVAKEGA